LPQIVAGFSTISNGILVNLSNPGDLENWIPQGVNGGPH
jgi:hypothetical protein